MTLPHQQRALPFGLQAPVPQFRQVPEHHVQPFRAQQFRP